MVSSIPNTNNLYTLIGLDGRVEETGVQSQVESYQRL